MKATITNLLKSKTNSKSDETKQNQHIRENYLINQPANNQPLR